MRIDEVIAPTSIGDALAALKRHPEGFLCAGGTTLFGDPEMDRSTDPRTIITLHRVSELRTVSRTDRYVEVGAMTPLSELLSLKEGFIPEALRESIRGIGSFAIRNLATLGGNLASSTRIQDCFPALACMDALVELRSSSSVRWINLNRLIGERGTPSLPKGEILTRVRIPRYDWNLNVIQKIGTPRVNSKNNILFAFLAKTDKRVIADLRIFYACEIALRSREAEAALVGKKIPLSARDFDLTQAAYSDLCLRAGLSDTHRLRFLALLNKVFSLLNEGSYT